MRTARITTEAETLSTPAVKRALKIAARFQAKPFNPKTGKGDQRAVITGIHLTSTGEAGLVIEACDGRTYFRTEVPNCPLVLDEVRRFGKGKLGEPVEGRYPNMSAIIPTEHTYSVRVNRDCLIALCDACPPGKTWWGDWTIALRRDSRKHAPIEVFRNDNGAQTKIGTLDEGAGAAPDGPSYFSAGLLRLALAAIEPDEVGGVWISTNGPLKPWIISKGNPVGGTFSMVMPRKPAWYNAI